MQDAQAPARDVGGAAERIEQAEAARGELHRQRVHGEVAAAQILGDERGSTCGSAPGRS
jgi:hypothetical protein